MVLVLELELFLLLKRMQIQSKRKFKLKIGATCISYKFGHQVLSSSAKVTSVKSQQPLSVSLRDPDPYIGPRIPGSNDNRLD